MTVLVSAKATAGRTKPMASLLIRDFPPELHLKLRQSAEKNRRSLTKEAIALLEMELQAGSPARPELPPPIDLGFPLTDEFLDRAKREGRE
jgi:plasmid stability protein